MITAGWTGPEDSRDQKRNAEMETQPLVRVKPNIPMQYESGNWDMGSLMVRTDGFIALWLCNPYTLTYEKSKMRCPIRWFIR